MTIRSLKLEILQRWKQSFTSKHEVLSDYSNPILGFIFWKSQLFSLFLAYNLISVSCGHAFFYWGNNTCQADLPDAPNMFLKSTENVLEVFEKKFQLKTWGRNKSQIRGWNLLTKPRVFSWKKFSNASETFSVDFKNMFGVSGRSAWPILLPQ